MTGDHEQIVDLMVRYGRACDTKDWQLLESCFVPDAFVSYNKFGAPLEGYAALEGYLRRALDALDGTQHLFTNYAIRTDGDAGHFRVSLHSQHVKHDAEGGATCAVGATYEIDAARVGGVWKMTRLELEPIWLSGNPAVLEHIADRDAVI
jgi:SnoaL-like domain